MVFGSRRPRRSPGRAGIGLVGAATLALACGPAQAVVGGGEAPAEGAVMVLSSKGGVCSAIVVAPDAVLTAGHCAAAGLEHRVHFRDASGQPVLVAVAGRAVHPGYDAGAIAARRRSIDLALLRTETPLPPRFAPATLSTSSPRAGEILTLAGYGAATPGDPRSTGTFRSVALPVIAPYGPSRILVWLKGPGRAGGCQGDSGGPVSDGTGVVAVTAWIGGTCGGLTQAVLVAPQRDWLDRTLSGWNRAARWH